MDFGNADNRGDALKPDVSAGGFSSTRVEFRHRIRQFLHFSEEVSRARGV